MAESLGGAVLDLSTDDTKLQKGLQRGHKGAKKLDSEFARVAANIGRNMDAAGRSLVNLGDQAVKAGQTLSARLTAPLLAFAGAGTFAAGNFQREMNAVRAVSGATGADFEALRMQAKQLGSTTQFSAGQAAQGMQFLARAGFSTNEIIGAMPGTLSLAAAGSLDLGRAADIASNVLTGMRLEVDQASRVADVLAKAASRANTDVEQLGEAMKFVAPLAAEAGFSLEDATAAIGKLSDAGIQASMAGTGLRRVMADLITPTSGVNEALKAAGLSATNARGEMLPFAEVIGNIREAGITGADAMELFGQRAGPVMAVLLNEGEAGLAAFSAELEGAGGTADRLASVQMEGLFGAFTELKSALEGLAIAVADSGLLDFFERMIDKTTGFVRNLSELNPATLRMGAIIGGLAAALGPALIGVGLFTKLLGFGLSAVGRFTVGVALLPGLFLRVGQSAVMAALRVGALTLAMGPVGLIVAGVSVALLAGFAAWQKWSGGITALAMPAITFIGELLGAVGGFLQRLGTSLVELGGIVRGAIGGIIDTFEDFAAVPLDVVREWRDAFVNKMGRIFDDVIDLGVDFVGGFATLINKLPFVDINVEALKATLRDLPGIAQAQVETLATTARGIGEQVAINFQEGQRQAQVAGGEGGGLLSLLPTPESLQERFAALFGVTVAGQTQLAQAQTEAQQQGLGQDPETGEPRSLLDMFFPSPDAIAKRVKEGGENAALGFSALADIAGNHLGRMSQITAGEFNFQKQTMAQTLGGMVSALADHSTKSFAIRKAAAVANAVVAIQQGIANALSLPFPSNLAAAATVAAKGLSVMSSLRSATLGSSSSPSFSGGGSRVGQAGGGITPETAPADEVDQGGPAVVTVRVDSERTRFTREEVEDMMNGIGDQVQRGRRIPKIRFED